MRNTLFPIVCLAFVLASSMALATPTLNSEVLLYCVEQAPNPGQMTIEIIRTQEGTFLRSNLVQEVIAIERTSLTSFENASGDVRLNLISRTPLQFEFSAQRDVRILNCHSFTR